MKIRCFLSLHKWVLFKKELHPYQALNSLQPTIIFHYGCNGCGKTRTETREEGYWYSFKPSDLEHM